MTEGILDSRMRKQEEQLEKDLPSLKGKELEDCGCGAFYATDVLEHCRDNQRINEAVGAITFLRGIDERCNIHNAVNRERERILKTLGIGLMNLEDGRPGIVKINSPDGEVFIKESNVNEAIDRLSNSGTFSNRNWARILKQDLRLDQ